MCAWDLSGSAILMSIKLLQIEFAEGLTSVCVNGLGGDV